MPSENAPALRRKLSDAFIRSVAESGKYADGEVPGLYLHVMASRKADKPASKHWRMYRLRGKENVFARRDRPRTAEAVTPYCHRCCCIGDVQDR